MHFHTFFLLSFFFNDTATTEIYTLSLHDALPIYAIAEDHERRRELRVRCHQRAPRRRRPETDLVRGGEIAAGRRRSEEHTSELQSQSNLVCRLLLEKKKKKNKTTKKNNLNYMKTL